jgi:hypothetical protein
MPAPQRVVVVRPINHILHMTLCVLTGGFWLLVYMPMLAHRGMQK